MKARMMRKLLESKYTNNRIHTHTHRIYMYKWRSETIYNHSWTECWRKNKKKKKRKKRCRKRKANEEEQTKIFNSNLLPFFVARFSLFFSPFFWSECCVFLLFHWFCFASMGLLLFLLDYTQWFILFKLGNYRWRCVMHNKFSGDGFFF